MSKCANLEDLARWNASRMKRDARSIPDKKDGDQHIAPYDLTISETKDELKKLNVRFVGYKRFIFNKTI